MNESGITDPCAERTAELEALLAGELEGPALERLEDHLKGCAACSRALEEAQEGLEVLRTLDAAPAPFAPVAELDGAAEERWRAFLERWAGHGTRIVPLRLRPLAAAALLLLGIALGRWALPASPAGPGDLADSQAWIGSDQVDALSRAEVLLDLGVPYLDGLRSVVGGVLGARGGDFTEADLLALRDRARRLIQDGESLQAVLDGDRDAEFLATIQRAEVFLEEIGAIGAGRSTSGLLLVRTEIEKTDLSARLASLDLSRNAADARAEAGWIGDEDAMPTGGRP